MNRNIIYGNLLRTTEMNALFKNLNQALNKYLNKFKIGNKSFK